MIIEDSVTGDANYDQRNYYNTTVGHPCYQLGDLIPGYVHEHVLRGLPSGATGNSGVIPATVTKGSTYYEEFSFTLPDSFEENQISLIGFVAKYGGIGQRSILNVTEKYLSGSPLSVRQNDEFKISVYPNPAIDILNLRVDLEKPVNVSIKLYDILGKETEIAKDHPFIRGRNTYSMDIINLKEGIYFLSISSAGKRTTKKIVIQR